MPDVGMFQTNDMLALRPPMFVKALVLEADTPKSITFPAGTKWVLFAATADFYVAWQGEASVPSEDISDGSGGELNPALRSVGRAGDFLAIASCSVASASVCIVTASFWK